MKRRFKELLLRYAQENRKEERRKIEEECQAYRCEKIASRLIESNPELKKTEVR